MTRSDAYWATMYERAQRDPVGGEHGPAWSLANPAGFRAYALMSRYSPNHEVHRFTDFYGRDRWVNGTGWKVMCMTLGMAAKGGQVTRMGDIAEAIGCCRQTVSRWITKLTAWGVIGSTVGRGRYGGLIVYARKVGDSFDWMAQRARDKLRAIYERKFKGAPIVRKAYNLPPYLVSKGAPLDFRARDEALADALHLDRSRRSGSIKCPAHEDGRASLSWKWWSGERLLLHCFAGCTFGDIKAAVGQ